MTYLTQNTLKFFLVKINDPFKLTKLIRDLKLGQKMWNRPVYLTRINKHTGLVSETTRLQFCASTVSGSEQVSLHPTTFRFSVYYCVFPFSKRFRRLLSWDLKKLNRNKWIKRRWMSWRSNCSNCWTKRKNLFRKFLLRSYMPRPGSCYSPFFFSLSVSSSQKINNWVPGTLFYRHGDGDILCILIFCVRVRKIGWHCAEISEFYVVLDTDVF